MDHRRQGRRGQEEEEEEERDEESNEERERERLQWLCHFAGAQLHSRCGVRSALNRLHCVRMHCFIFHTSNCESVGFGLSYKLHLLQVKLIPGYLLFFFLVPLDFFIFKIYHQSLL